MSYRLEKFASTLREALGEILGRESLDPELRRVTVLRVLPTPDLKRADVFVACPADAAAAALERLRGAAGFIKKLLARRMRLRTMPELDFQLDESLAFERRLAALQGAGPDGAPGVGLLALQGGGASAGQGASEDPGEEAGR
jgi:ribosome-binding factor A